MLVVELVIGVARAGEVLEDGPAPAFGERTGGGAIQVDGPGLFSPGELAVPQCLDVNKSSTGSLAHTWHSVLKGQ